MLQEVSDTNPYERLQHIPETNATSHSYKPLLLDKRIKDCAYSCFVGYLLNWMGFAYKVVDDSSHKSFYLSRQGLASLTTAGLETSISISADKSRRVSKRILEILNPVIGKDILVSKIHELAEVIQKQQTIQTTQDVDGLIEKLEEIRDKHLQFLPLVLPLLKNVLKPGDMLFKKQYEDNKNPVCDAQRCFQGFIKGNKEREAYKFSHVAVYVGDGQIAEAVTRKGTDPQVRVISLDDPHFALMKKNQYCVVRPTNKRLGKKAAKVFKSFATPFIPKDAAGDNLADEKKPALKYNYIEAARSLWHSTKFSYFAKQRYLKYYSDYADKLPPTQIISPRQLFCSYAVAMSYQIADALVKRKTPPVRLKEIVGETPTKYGNRYIRAIVRGIWSRYHAIINGKALEQFVQLKFDALRMNPQDLRNYVLLHPEQFTNKYIIKNRSELGL